MISQKECTEQVRKMGNQVGLLFYHFAKTLTRELGDERGKELILRAVKSYGTERGLAIRKKVQEAGLDLTIANFSKFSDLPSAGWEHNEEGTTYCCYAEAWMTRGVEELGRLYCEVDFALLKAYNPKIRMKRAGTVLNGDPWCKVIVEE